jgi:Mn-containing catalase
MQYSFRAWNAHIPGKYRDLLFSTTELPNTVEKTAGTIRDKLNQE